MFRVSQTVRDGRNASVCKAMQRYQLRKHRCDQPLSVHRLALDVLSLSGDRQIMV